MQNSVKRLVLEFSRPDTSRENIYISSPADNLDSVTLGEAVAKILTTQIFGTGKDILSFEKAYYRESYKELVDVEV